MSERTPLLSGSVNGPSTTSLPSRRDVQNNLPTKGQRIKAAQALGAIQAGKLPYVLLLLYMSARADETRSQAQLSKILQLLAESDTLKAAGGPHSRTARLGPEGQKVLENVKAVINATRQWGEAKNGDDLLQNFLVRSFLPLDFPSTNTQASTTRRPPMSMSMSMPLLVHPTERCLVTLSVLSSPSAPSQTS